MPGMEWTLLSRAKVAKASKCSVNTVLAWYGKQPKLVATKDSTQVSHASLVEHDPRVL